MQHTPDFINHPPKTYFELLIAKQKDNSTFTILIFFLLAFILSRTTVYLYGLGLLPPYPFENFFGTHVHHFVFGIGLISLVGLLSLSLPYHILKEWRLKLAAVYGFGLGWIIDEFGMWLHLEDNYLIRQSYDAIIVTSIILINLIFFKKIWKRIFYKVFKKFQAGS